ncbi:unnamed protein product [Sphagnum troendelagicum]|uniref:Glycoside hydrolase family 38 central domain-containing protein n=1 Tax=Sphagnum troendelagicum TaxID=128251 RepID=A0ABP0V535_9BRYO
MELSPPAADDLSTIMYTSSTSREPNEVLLTHISILCTIAGLAHYLKSLNEVEARHLEFLVGKNQTGPDTDSLKEAMAIVQHHDGVSGIEKQHSANDYVQRLVVGSAKAEKVFNSALVALIGYATLIAKQHVGGRRNGSFEQRRVLHQKDISSSIPKDVTASLKQVVVVYNPIGWNREEYIHFPLRKALVSLPSSGSHIQHKISGFEILH